jgi:hypothetical protein
MYEQKVLKNHSEYPGKTCFDKKARNYRYLFDRENFRKARWEELTLKERDYWRGLVQIDEEYAKERFQKRNEHYKPKRHSKNTRVRERTYEKRRS